MLKTATVFPQSDAALLISVSILDTVAPLNLRKENKINPVSGFFPKTYFPRFCLSSHHTAREILQINLS